MCRYKKIKLVFMLVALCGIRKPPIKKKQFWDFVLTSRHHQPTPCIERSNIPYWKKGVNKFKFSLGQQPTPSLVQPPETKKMVSEASLRTITWILLNVTLLFGQLKLITCTKTKTCTLAVVEYVVKTITCKGNMWLCCVVAECGNN